MRRALVLALIVCAATPALAQREGPFWGRTRTLETWEALREQGMRFLESARDLQTRLGLEPANPRREEVWERGAQALQRFEEALSLHPDDPDLHFAAYWTAEVMMSQTGLDRNLAVVRHIEALRRLRPIHAEGLMLSNHYVEALGRLAWLSRGEDALNLFRRCADAYAPYIARLQEANGGFESDLTYSNAAEVMMAAGRLDDALVYYKRSAALGPTRPLNHYGLAIALDRAGEGESALRSMREAIRLDVTHILATGDREDADVYFVPRGDKLAYEALAAEADGRRLDAVRAWREFLNGAPDAQPAYKARARQHLKALGAR